MTSVAMGRSAPRILVFCMYRDRARRMYLPPLLLALNPTTDPSPTNQPVRRVDKIFFFSLCTLATGCIFLLLQLPRARRSLRLAGGRANHAAYLPPPRHSMTCVCDAFSSNSRYPYQIQHRVTRHSNWNLCLPPIFSTLGRAPSRI